MRPHAHSTFAQQPRISFSRGTASKWRGNSTAQWICHRPDVPRSHVRNARARTSPFSSTGSTRRRLPYRRNATPYTALLIRLTSAEKPVCTYSHQLSPTHRCRTDVPASRVRVMSQNGPHLLGSNKGDLAASIAPNKKRAGSGEAYTPPHFPQLQPRFGGAFSFWADFTAPNRVSLSPGRRKCRRR